jgi:hypothetical protein
MSALLRLAVPLVMAIVFGLVWWTASRFGLAGLRRIVLTITVALLVDLVLFLLLWSWGAGS